MEFYSFDDSYLQRLREHDFQTEQHFVAYFSKLILIKLRSRVRSSSAIDDIRQETFVRVLKVVRAEGGVRNAERLGGFVNSVCNNVLQEFYRSSGRAELSDEGIAEPPDKTIDLEGALVTKQTREQVRQVLAAIAGKGPAPAEGYLHRREGERRGVSGVWRGPRLSSSPSAPGQAKLSSRLRRGRRGSANTRRMLALATKRFPLPGHYREDEIYGSF